MTRTFRQIPRIQGIDKNLVKILEPMRDAIEQLTNGPGRALRVPDVGNGLAFTKNKLIATTIGGEITGDLSDVDDLAAQVAALIVSAQQFRAYFDLQLANLSAIAMSLNTLELDTNGNVTSIVGADVPGDDTEEVPFNIQTGRFGTVRPADQFEDGAAYALGDFVIPSVTADVSTGLIYEVTIAGVAGAEPDWLTANDPGETVASGAVTFTARTPAVVQPFKVGRVDNVSMHGIDGTKLLDFSVPDRALQPYTRTHVVLQPEEADDIVVIPGERGRDGAPGQSVLVVFQPEDVEDVTPLPGERGPVGPMGPTGATGSSLPVVLQPEDPDDVLSMPGERGATGATGAQGVTAPPVVLQPEDGEDTLLIPGARGLTGATGATGATSPPVVLQPEDADDTISIPGERGVQGPIGATGAQGPPVVLQPEDAEDVPPVPGQRGLTGATGASGQSPPPIVLPTEDADDVPPLPGERGLTGAIGPAGVSSAPIVLQPEEADDPTPIPGERGLQGVAGATGSPGSGGGSTVIVQFEDGDDVELPLMPLCGYAVLAGQNIFNGRQFIVQDIQAIVGSKPRQLHIIGGPTGTTCGIHIQNQTPTFGINHQRCGIERSFATFGLVLWSDDETVQRNALFMDQGELNDVQLTSMRYGNPTDNPRHQFYGGIQQSFLLGGTPARISTVSTEFSLSYVKRMQMLSTNRLVLQGTARLRVAG